ncbi:MAG: hypothetical protein RL276_159, partial [Bacteroidota bacterium]
MLRMHEERTGSANSCQALTGAAAEQTTTAATKHLSSQCF